MNLEDQIIFLTGVTGFLGHYVLAELLQHTASSVRLLVRDPVEAATVVAGLLAPLNVDLVPFLASGRVQWERGRLPDDLNGSALRGVDLIIHAAASTQFALREGEPLRSNVDGTQALLNIAASAGVSRFCFISTAYVGGTRIGIVPESILPQPHRTANDYEKSKWIAENLVREWSSHNRRATILRPSILIGDLHGGRATSFGGIYLLARSVELLARAVHQESSCDRHSIPLRITGDPNVRPNLIPVCWAARRIVKRALSDESGLSVYNLANPSPPSSLEIKQWLEAFYDLAGGTFTKMQWPWSGPSRFEEGFYAAGKTVLDYFNRDLSFECRSSQMEIGEPRLVDRAHFLNCLQYAVEHNWGRGAARPVHRSTGTIDLAWYFEDYLLAQVPRSRVSRVSTLTAVVRFIIEGPGGGNWTCRYEGGRLVGIEGGAAQCEQFGFRVRRHAFDKIVRGKLRLQDAFYGGDAQIFGDILTALKMVPIMEMFLKECPVGAPLWDRSDSHVECSRRTCIDSK